MRVSIRMQFVLSVYRCAIGYKTLKQTAGIGTDSCEVLEIKRQRILPLILLKKQNIK